MKLDSKYFDKIRIRSRQHAEPKPEVVACEWEGCDQAGIYKAPKGNRAVGQYHHFCLEHVRHYNQVFNFFEGMSPEEMERSVMRERETDGRPSWGFGAKAAPHAGPRMPPNMHPGANPRVRRNADGSRNADPFGVFARFARYQQKKPAEERVRPLQEQDRRAFETLGFKGYAKPDDVKAAYKSLVKIHHPDANGGDRSSEDRLRAIISAYSHLKKKGFTGQ